MIWNMNNNTFLTENIKQGIEKYRRKLEGVDIFVTIHVLSQFSVKKVYIYDANGYTSF